MRAKTGVVIVAIAWLLLAAALLASCGDDDAAADDPTGGAETIEGSIETLDGHTFYCFRYSKHSYGGLWCTMKPEGTE